MTLPGSTVSIIDAPRRRVPATDTAPWFVVGTSSSGPLIPVAVTSLSEFTTTFGPRQSYSFLYDALDAFFSERGGIAYVSRTVGPAAAAAFHDFSDGTGVTLRVAAEGPGTYGNSLLAAIVVPTAGQFQIVISNAGGVIETSPVFTAKADAVTWSRSSPNVAVSSLAGTGLPVAVTATALTGGVDDVANITDTQRQAALDRFTAALGPGQVSEPGNATATAWTRLLNHAAANNRFALLDAADTATVSTHTSNAATLRALGTTQARVGQFLAPWVIGPGLTPGQTRDIPPSAIQAGLAARNDAAGRPGQAVAGDNGTSLFALDVKNTWIDADLSTLNDAGVNVIRNFGGVIQTYANRTLTDPVLDANWLQASIARLFMSIRAKGKAIADNHVFRLLDGQGFELSDFKADLSAMLTTLWQDGEIYGDTPQDAYVVDVTAPVNTDATIAAGKLIANVAVKPSRSAEQVSVQIGNSPLTEAF